MKALVFAVAFVALHVACDAAQLIHVQKKNTRYGYSYWHARQACKDIGASLATKTELEMSRQAGYSNCHCGWSADKTAWYPMAIAADGCGSRADLHSCTWGDQLWDAYCYVGDPTGNCSAPLGVETEEITDHQMIASSEFDSWFPPWGNTQWRAQIARLHNTDLVNAWRPVTNSRKNEYLEVDLEVPTAVSGILSQGASRLNKKMWVESYKVKYSKDGDNYRTIQEDGQDKIFEGNTDNNGVARSMFPEPVLTRYVRIIPYTWHSHIAMRVELLGCNMEIYELARSLARDTVVQNVGGRTAIVDTGEKEPEK